LPQIMVLGYAFVNQPGAGLDPVCGHRTKGGNDVRIDGTYGYRDSVHIALIEVTAVVG